MSRFYLKKLSIFSQGKTPSYIEFSKGLNIIFGVSDTGKTCILKCIDFVFGSKNKEPIPITHGYEQVELLIETEKGNVTLKRIIGKTKTTIISCDPDFPSGDFTQSELGVILLPLIGIKNNPSIIKNSRYEKQRLTWRTFMHSFLISEEEIIQTAPILINKESTAKTSSLSALIYLISALDFDSITPQEDKKIKEARKRAVENYIYKDISKLESRNNELNDILRNFTEEDSQLVINQLTGELSDIDKEISIQINEQNNILAQILKKQDQLAECDIRLKNYSEYRSQCIGDVERLGFIVDGENNFKKIPQLDRCPYCENQISHKQQESYSEVANKELKRILGLLKGLEVTELDTQKEKSAIQKDLVKLIQNKNRIQDYIKQALKPKQQSIQKTLNDFKAIIQLKNELEINQKMTHEKWLELQNLQNENTADATQFKPKEHFPTDFQKEFSTLLEEILKECQYENLITSTFSMDTFDAIINSKHKDSYGKGFRAFINMSVVLTMRKYLVEKGKYAPRLLVVDSPLLSLEQGVDESAPESMKTALMSYIMNNQAIGQTIIIENKIPNLDYAKYGVNLIEFTKGKSEGRYGLLADVKS